MAGNSKSGRAPVFPLSEAELVEKVNKYKKDLEDGVFPRASWPHFCASLDSTEADIKWVMQQGESKESVYRGQAKVLKKMATWIRGQMMSASGWHGQLTSRAIFALKQDVGDGVKWSDQDGKQTGPVEVRVLFGGDDKRGRNAGK